MRFTAQEEYGLRCLAHLVRAERGESLTIAEIAERESLTVAYVAKVMRTLREAGFVTSIRGQQGGYRLACTPAEVRLDEVIEALDGPFHSPTVCDRYTGHGKECAHSDGCSVRSLWTGLDGLIRSFLSSLTLQDLARSEPTLERHIDRLLQQLPKRRSRLSTPRRKSGRSSTREGREPELNAAGTTNLT